MPQDEICVARLNPNQSAKVGKLHPVVILQADTIKTGLATVVVMPLTPGPLLHPGTADPDPRP